MNILGITVLDNPSPFLNPFQFEVTFESLTALHHDLDFTVVYVGSAEDSGRDQILEEVGVGPVPVGELRGVVLCCFVLFSVALR